MERLVLDTVERALDMLREVGLLLVADLCLPSVATLLTGAPVRGSWWGHPSGKEIYTVCTLLDAHADVGDARLVSGKLTYVYRRLWPALVGIGTAGEHWQTSGLSPLATRLHVLLQENGVAQTDELDGLGVSSKKLLGEAARELEAVLLAHGEGAHTSRGAHTKRLEIWGHWAARRGMHETPLAASEGKHLLEQTLAYINGRWDSQGRLPWERAPIRS